MDAGMDSGGQRPDGLPCFMTWNHLQISHPPPQKTVLVRVKGADGNVFHLRAMWVKRCTVPAIYEGPDTHRDREGQLWMLGGWYEDSWYSDQVRMPRGDQVTHWMPFPDDPPPVYGVDYMK